MRLRKEYDNLNSNDKSIANYFLANPDRVFHMPIAQLAREAGVSQAAWVRFAKTMGFSGLKELKKSLFDEYNSDDEPATVFTDVKDYSNIDSLIKALKSSHLQAIEDTAQFIDLQVLSNAVTVIANAQTVRLFGVGASAIVAYDFANKLLRIGKNVCFNNDSHFQLAYAANSTPQDVGIFISYSGQTKETLETIKIVKANSTPTISLTRFEKSPLAQNADIQLYSVSPEVNHRSGAMSSRIAQSLVIDILFTAIANRDYEKVVGHLQKSYDSCQTHRTV